MTGSPCKGLLAGVCGDHYFLWSHSLQFSTAVLFISLCGLPFSCVNGWLYAKCASFHPSTYRTSTNGISRELQRTRTTNVFCALVLPLLWPAGWLAGA
ncbi:hypothetical protein BDY21DRAFT_341377 [Lineolata rhizophorae]|uniref:Uncharacterized protein n=1 Tax=Lineolata rhizophorae TaxID=578093 RepID=A0A6A6P5T6_9PEZI|nr:hypothetical protein BDY21DRAFT_341377 [Lineolata rhizophorae]